MESEELVYSNILLFDGVCNLCNGIVQFVIKRDSKRRFLFASLQSETGQEILKDFNLPAANFDSFILISDGKCYQKSTAALKVAKELNGFWKAFYYLIFIPKPIRDFFYNLIAKNRYKIFGKRESCMIPTPELKSRFLQ
ncbi:MAG: thiol-disulfide oxidoreductase DCC family protein [Sphingobacteriales bacterium]|nr:MAG: thiol-disulfide oxidoreductase DCC family protein [Sphingobacteriales bacterium]